MLRKNWSAIGSFLKEDRPRALDLLGFRSQLVFNTFLNKYLVRRRARPRPRLRLRRGARPQPRHGRLLRRRPRGCSPVGYVPLADFDRARAMAEEAVAMGCQALLVPSACPAGHSPSHTGLFPVWAIAQEAGLPIVFHVGGGGQLLLDPTTSTTACRRSPTSTAAPRTSARSTTWRSPSRRCRRSRR